MLSDLSNICLRVFIQLIIITISIKYVLTLFVFELCERFINIVLVVNLVKFLFKLFKRFIKILLVLLQSERYGKV